jgi:hypothetical protein
MLQSPRDGCLPGNLADVGPLRVLEERLPDGIRNGGVAGSRAAWSTRR